MKFHCTTFNPGEQRVTQPLIFFIQILYVNNQLVMSPIVSLRNSTKRKFIIMYSARSTTVWMCHKKKELELRELKRNMFNHNLIFKKDLAYSPKVHMWWLVSTEGEGQYCLICKKFDSKNPQTRRNFFSATSNPNPTRIETTSASTQTESTEEDKREEQEHQEEEQALIKLGLAHFVDTSRL